MEASEQTPAANESYYGRRRAARRRRRRQRVRHSGAPTLNFAPMIDVTFLLLIFFLVTTTFDRAEGLLASKLPRDTGNPGVALPISPIVIRLTPTGPGHNDFTMSIDHFSQAPTNFALLPEFLRGIHQQPGFDRETPVVIIAESGVRWDHVVNCWNAALRAGCERIAFGEP